MLSNFLLVASQVITLFLLMGVGFVLAKKGHLMPKGVGQMSFLLLYIVCPCLIINSLQIEFNTVMLKNMGLSALLFGGCYVIFIAVATPLFRNRPATTRSSLRFGVVFANTGFMGFPLVKAVFGDEALIYATASLIVFSLLQWTYGVSLMGGKMSLKNALLNPGTIGVYIGLPLFLLGIKLPSALGNAVTFLSDLNTPLAMLVIGCQMAFANIRETFTHPLLLVASGMRLVILPALVAAALLPFHLPYLLYGTCVLLAAAPAAGVTSILADRWGQNTAAAAQLVTLSTLLSMVTLPAFALLSQYLWQTF